MVNKQRKNFSIPCVIREVYIKTTTRNCYTLIIHTYISTSKNLESRFQKCWQEGAGGIDIQHWRENGSIQLL